MIVPFDSWSPRGALWSLDCWLRDEELSGTVGPSRERPMGKLVVFLNHNYPWNKLKRRSRHMHLCCCERVLPFTFTITRRISPAQVASGTGLGCAFNFLSNYIAYLKNWEYLSCFASLSFLRSSPRNKKKKIQKWKLFVFFCVTDQSSDSWGHLNNIIVAKYIEACGPPRYRNKVFKIEKQKRSPDCLPSIILFLVTTVASNE